MKTHNHIELDFNKVAYVDFYYSDVTETRRRQTRPTRPTVRGQDIEPFALARFHFQYPQETMLERAKRLDILDRWYPVCRFQLTNSHSLTYVGEKAVTMHNRWRAITYGKSKSQSS